MNQYLRICIYYILILALTYAFVKFLNVPVNLSKWQLKTTEDLSIIDIDSTFLTDLNHELDSLFSDTTKIEKDTVITHHNLSCPTQFLKQLTQLHKQLQTTSETNKNIRILHFGDSQIEGDRITSHLREAFQKRYGGSGPGLTTIYDPQRINPSVWLDNEGEWHINRIYNQKRQLPDKTYGLLGQTASLKANSSGVFKIRASRWAEQHASHYQKVRLFIAPHTDSVQIKATIKTTEVINDTLTPSKALTEINWEFEQLSPSLKFEMRSTGDIHILGCALDSINGVSVDNIALRGQSSPLLHQTNGVLFQAMCEHLDIGMVIIQFGTNVIPTIAPNYHFYKVQLAKQFDLLKAYIPNVPVVVIGISDAAYKNNGQIVPYTHLNRINNAQKAIALQYNFGYYDLYSAMGGKGSIIKWSQKSPPWALTDYIHLSRRGGQEVANQFIKALWHNMGDSISQDTSLISTVR